MIAGVSTTSPAGPRMRARGAAPPFRGLVCRVLVCAATFVAATASAQTAVSPLSAPAASAAGDNAQALRGWLARIRDAALRSNYVGTLVDSNSGTVLSSRVAHYCDGRNEFERVEALDGEARGILRINDEVRTVWPRYRLAVVEPVDPRASFPSLVSGGEQHIPDFYELHVQPSERVAGHDADRLLLKARDAERFDHVIWADRATGLLLRVDVQVDGRTLESSAFSEVRIGVRPDPGAIVAELHHVDGYHVMKPAMQSTRLEAEGWTMQPGLMPPGFQSLGCVRRALTMAGAASGAAAAAPQVLQQIFSDGLTHVSLFIEPYQPQRHKGSGLSVIGATHTLSRRVNDYWITAVGDVPPAALDQFVRALERKP